MQSINDTPQQNQDTPQATGMEQSQQEIPTVTQKTNSPQTMILVVVGVILLAAVGAGAYYMGMQNAAQIAQTPEAVEASPEPEGVACTLEAKICPDGSSVGRTGPNCEFEECPVSEVPQGVEFSLITSQIGMKDPSTLEEIKNDNVDIVFTLPEGSQVNNNQVNINGVWYTVDVNVFAGPCGMQVEETDCGYDEEFAQNADVLKLWRDNQGTFALNYISVKQDNYNLASIFITKLAPDSFIAFTQKEVDMWKQIYSTIHIVKNN